mmetsp:Transcript_2600/g.7625  ORF Transcript_2600/g.7625 Transcript_2600/m.7625 type:complete len:203 (+) Transcript_2600:201-809(+)
MSAPGPRKSISRGISKRVSDLMNMSTSTKGAKKAGTLAAIRGSGPAWEGDADMARDVAFCFCLASKAKKHLVIKGEHLFAFGAADDDAACDYAVPLSGIATEVDDGAPHLVALYKMAHGGKEYVLSFADEAAVHPFCVAVKQAADLVALDEIKSRLGHEKVPRTASVRNADAFGKSMAKKQPDHDVSLSDAASAGLAPGMPL